MSPLVYGGLDWLGLALHGVFIYLSSRGRRCCYLFGAGASIALMGFGFLAESVASICANASFLLLHIYGFTTFVHAAPFTPESTRRLPLAVAPPQWIVQNPKMQPQPPIVVGTRQAFELGDTLIDNTFRQEAPSRQPWLAYIHEGLVKGAWNRSVIAPTTTATAVVAGDRRWIGVDAFKFGENLFRYTALAPTVATLVPLAEALETPRETLVGLLRSVSLDWCTAASIHTIKVSLYRRVVLLLFDISREFPRPEIELRQSDIADLLGVARQTLSPVLKRLKTDGLLDLGYGQIVVTEPDLLESHLRAHRR